MLDIAFGDDDCKSTIIVIVFYRLKSAGASFRIHLAHCVQELACESCKAKPDLWKKPEIRQQDKFKYYSYILCYADDILCIYHDQDDVWNKLTCYVS